MAAADQHVLDAELQVLAEGAKSSLDEITKEGVSLLFGTLGSRRREYRGGVALKTRMVCQHLE